MTRKKLNSYEVRMFYVLRVDAKDAAEAEKRAKTIAMDELSAVTAVIDDTVMVGPSRAADRIDGYNRDDLGESPDY